jgi:hypothetical protein
MTYSSAFHLHHTLPPTCSCNYVLLFFISYFTYSSFFFMCFIFSAPPTLLLLNISAFRYPHLLIFQRNTSNFPSPSTCSHHLLISPSLPSPRSQSPLPTAPVAGWSVAVNYRPPESPFTSRLPLADGRRDAAAGRRAVSRGACASRRRRRRDAAPEVTPAAGVQGDTHRLRRRLSRPRCPLRASFHGRERMTEKIVVDGRVTLPEGGAHTMQLLVLRLVMLVLLLMQLPGGLMACHLNLCVH